MAQVLKLVGLKYTLL